MRVFEQTELTDMVLSALKSYTRDLEYLIDHPEVSLSRTVPTLIDELTKVHRLIGRIKAEKLDVQLYERE